ncbi:hypothetical protein EJ05DRAFT_144712 [Pseudovirgaria hyperparasitica]|uniref:Uncharacterized protein n=1 Tax=Pseudovirgaria hyperparasitica TaxID=470096 RepID=A0A6A6VVE4_9PEZI|nr:uncharacterized protein EJ05DRAFT_144712 [Pseudovirgaria hyperparasitica]KAF2754542.1 hypothetical protein EJ05DRAFT_144712 [Pseudovirgaria hyperparasitica]
MPMWPFGRRRRNTEGPHSTAAERKPISEHVRPGTPTSQSPGLARKNSSRHSRRRRRKSSPHSIRNLAAAKENHHHQPDTAHANNPPADYDTSSSHSPTRERNARDKRLTALPSSPVLATSPHLRPITLRETPYNFSLDNNADSAMSLPNARERGKLQRPQSLRTPDTLTRRKSIKRKPDPVREEEIRQMMAPVSIKRPATFSGSILRRDTKKMRGGLNRNFERPPSEVSLPMQGSVHSSMSGYSELKGFRVSALDVFSARPKLRYSASVQLDSTALQRASPPPTRTSSRKDKQPESRRDSNEMDRIGELAEDMDASELRDVMERDARRRARKKEREEEKLRRKLERRAEKQRAKEARAREPRREPETGALERRYTAPQGLAIEHAVSPVPTTPQSHIRHETLDVTMQNSAHHDDDTYEAIEQHYDDSAVPEFAHPVPRSPSPLRTPTEEPIIGTAQAINIRFSRGSMQQSPPPQDIHARNISNISYLPDLISEVQPPPVEDHPAFRTQPTDQSNEQSSDDRRSGADGRRGSVSSAKRMGGWASILRKATFSRKKPSNIVRSSPSQASFSNTSRESMSRQPLPAHLVQSSAATPPPRSVSRASGTPSRTMSKFREDLPELPLSPPDSRMQSPEALDLTPHVPQLSERRGMKAPAKIETEPTHQQATPEPEETISEEMPDSPWNASRRTSRLKSLSMASVDSEASWLSGRPVKRAATQRYRGSISSRQQTEASAEDVFETANESSEEHDVHEDEFFQRLSPTHDRRMSLSSDPLNRKPSSTMLGTIAAAQEAEALALADAVQHPVGRPLSGDEVLHTGIARTPTVVHRISTARVKSSEGLVNLYEGSDTARSTPSPFDHEAVAEEPPEGPSEAQQAQAIILERAKSIDLGRRHGRHVSAGSAKLLDIKRLSANPPVPDSPRTPAPDSAYQHE